MLWQRGNEKHSKSKKTLVCVPPKGPAIKVQGIHRAGLHHGPGQDAWGYCMSAIWENTLLASGPMLAVCLDMQSEVTQEVIYYSSAFLYWGQMVFNNLLIYFGYKFAYKNKNATIHYIPNLPAWKNSRNTNSSKKLSFLKKKNRQILIFFSSLSSLWPKIFIKLCQFINNAFVSISFTYVQSKMCRLFWVNLGLYTFEQTELTINNLVTSCASYYLKKASLEVASKYILVQVPHANRSFYITSTFLSISLCLHKINWNIYYIFCKENEEKMCIYNGIGSRERER